MKREFSFRSAIGIRSRTLLSLGVEYLSNVCTDLFFGARPACSKLMKVCVPSPVLDTKLQRGFGFCLCHCFQKRSARRSCAGLRCSVPGLCNNYFTDLTSVLSVRSVAVVYRYIAFTSAAGEGSTGGLSTEQS